MPNRAPAELRWEDEPADADARKPSRLTRAAIVVTALRLADDEGLPAVSIRRVARELGVRPMSLYTHIASKDDLLDLMLDTAIAEVLVPEPLPEDWREGMRLIARRTRSTFAAHPWMLDAYSLRSSAGSSPNAEAHARQSREVVARLGLDEEATMTVLGVVDEYALGHVLVARVRAELGVPPRGGEDGFGVGLEAILDGLGRRFGAK
jgi:AcrR family transcriptional regulator